MIMWYTKNIESSNDYSRAVGQYGADATYKLFKAGATDAVSKLNTSVNGTASAAIKVFSESYAKDLYVFNAMNVNMKSFCISIEIANDLNHSGHTELADKFKAQVLKEIAGTFGPDAIVYSDGMKIWVLCPEDIARDKGTKLDTLLKSDRVYQVGTRNVITVAKKHSYKDAVEWSSCSIPKDCFIPEVITKQQRPLTSKKYGEEVVIGPGDYSSKERFAIERTLLATFNFGDMKLDQSDITFFADNNNFSIFKELAAMAEKITPKNYVHEIDRIARVMKIKIPDKVKTMLLEKNREHFFIKKFSGTDYHVGSKQALDVDLKAIQENQKKIKDVRSEPIRTRYYIAGGDEICIIIDIPGRKTPVYLFADLAAVGASNDVLGQTEVDRVFFKKRLEIINELIHGKYKSRLQEPGAKVNDILKEVLTEADRTLENEPLRIVKDNIQSTASKQFYEEQYTLRYDNELKKYIYEIPLKEFRAIHAKVLVDIDAYRKSTTGDAFLKELLRISNELKLNFFTEEMYNSRGKTVEIKVPVEALRTYDQAFYDVLLKNDFFSIQKGAGATWLITDDLISGKDHMKWVAHMYDSLSKLKMFNQTANCDVFDLHKDIVSKTRMKRTSETPAWMTDTITDMVRKNGPEALRKELAGILLTGNLKDEAVRNRLIEMIPELKGLIGLAQNKTYHDTDAFTHTLKVVENMRALSNDPALLLAALLHDIGKYDTTTSKDWIVHRSTLSIRDEQNVLDKLFENPRAENLVPKENIFDKTAFKMLPYDDKLAILQQVNEKRISHKEHERYSAERSRTILDKLQYPQEIRTRVLALIQNHTFNGSMKDPKKITDLSDRVGGSGVLAELFHLQEADVLASTRSEESMKDLARIKELAIHSNIISLKDLLEHGSAKDILVYIELNHGTLNAKDIQNIYEQTLSKTHPSYATTRNIILTKYVSAEEIFAYSKKDIIKFYLLRSKELETKEMSEIRTRIYKEILPEEKINEHPLMKKYGAHMLPNGVLEITGDMPPGIFSRILKECGLETDGLKLIHEITYKTSPRASTVAEWVVNPLFTDAHKIVFNVKHARTRELLYTMLRDIYFMNVDDIFSDLHKTLTALKGTLKDSAQKGILDKALTDLHSLMQDRSMYQKDKNSKELLRGDQQIALLKNICENLKKISEFRRISRSSSAILTRLTWLNGLYAAAKSRPGGGNINEQSFFIVNNKLTFGGNASTRSTSDLSEFTENFEIRVNENIVLAPSSKTEAIDLFSEEKNMIRKPGSYSGESWKNIHTGIYQLFNGSAKGTSMPNGKFMVLKEGKTTRIILIDPPIGFLTEALKLGYDFFNLPKDVTVELFISHNHGDHTQGIKEYMLFTEYMKEVKQNSTFGGDITAAEGVFKKTERLIHAQNEIDALHGIQEKNGVSLHVSKGFIPIASNHSVETTGGIWYEISSSGEMKIFMFTSDTGKYIDPDLPLKYEEIVQMLLREHPEIKDPRKISMTIVADSEGGMIHGDSAELEMRLKEKFPDTTIEVLPEHMTDATVPKNEHISVLKKSADVYVEEYKKSCRSMPQDIAFKMIQERIIHDTLAQLPEKISSGSNTDHDVQKEKALTKATMEKILTAFPETRFYILEGNDRSKWVCFKTADGKERLIGHNGVILKKENTSSFFTIEDAAMNESISHIKGQESGSHISNDKDISAQVEHYLKENEKIAKKGKTVSGNISANENNPKTEQTNENEKVTVQDENAEQRTKVSPEALSNDYVDYLLEKKTITAEEAALMKEGLKPGAIATKEQQALIDTFINEDTFNEYLSMKLLPELQHINVYDVIERINKLPIEQQKLIYSKMEESYTAQGKAGVIMGPFGMAVMVLAGLGYSEWLGINNPAFNMFLSMYTGHAATVLTQNIFFSFVQKEKIINTVINAFKGLSVKNVATFLPKSFGSMGPGLIASKITSAMLKKLGVSETIAAYGAMGAFMLPDMGKPFLQKAILKFSQSPLAKTIAGRATTMIGKTLSKGCSFAAGYFVTGEIVNMSMYAYNGITGRNDYDLHVDAQAKLFIDNIMRSEANKGDMYAKAYFKMQKYAGWALSDETLAFITSHNLFSDEPAKIRTYVEYGTYKYLEQMGDSISSLFEGTLLQDIINDPSVAEAIMKPGRTDIKVDRTKYENIFNSIDDTKKDANGCSQKDYYFATIKTMKMIASRTPPSGDRYYTGKIIIGGKLQEVVNMPLQSIYMLCKEFTSSIDIINVNGKEKFVIKDITAFIRFIAKHSFSIDDTKKTKTAVEHYIDMSRSQYLAAASISADSTPFSNTGARQFIYDPKDPKILTVAYQTKHVLKGKNGYPDDWNDYINIISRRTKDVLVTKKKALTIKEQIKEVEENIATDMKNNGTYTEDAYVNACTQNTRLQELYTERFKCEQEISLHNKGILRHRMMWFKTKDPYLKKMIMRTLKAYGDTSTAWQTNPGHYKKLQERYDQVEASNAPTTMKQQLLAKLVTEATFDITVNDLTPEEKASVLVENLTQNSTNWPASKKQQLHTLLIKLLDGTITLKKDGTGWKIHDPKMTIPEQDKEMCTMVLNDFMSTGASRNYMKNNQKKIDTVGPTTITGIMSESYFEYYAAL